MSSNFEDAASGGPCLRDLTRDSPLDAIITRETAQLRLENDGLFAAGVDREMRLRAYRTAEDDINAEADRQSGLKRLRSV